MSAVPALLFLLNEQNCTKVNQERVVDLKDIKAIIDLMKKNAISEFELEKQDFKIKLKRGTNGGAPTGFNEETQTVIYGGSPANLPPPPQAILPAQTLPQELELKSPMVGTFYRAPSPEAAPYIEIGTELNIDSVVCIIEAMKVMNEIKAEIRGVVTQILVENGKPVEFGQPLVKLRPL